MWFALWCTTTKATLAGKLDPPVFSPEIRHELYVQGKWLYHLSRTQVLALS